MHRAAAVALALALLGGCETPRRSPRALRPAAPSDDGVELAAMLPEEFDRCVVARPRRLAQQRRAMVVPHSWAEPRAFDADLAVEAYATASVETPTGRRARRSYYRFADVGPPPRERVRDLPVRWADDPCEGWECRRPAARWVDARTLEIARHEWPERRSRRARMRGVLAPGCVATARANVDAFEIAVSREPTRGPLPSPEWSVRVLRASDGLVMRTDYVFHGEEPAELFARWTRSTDHPGSGGLVPLPLGDREVERNVHRVRVTHRRAWAEVELALEDERLRREARALGRRERRPADPEQVDVSRPEAVRHQLRLYRARLGQLSGEPRRALAERLATLLDRALEAHPHTADLAEARARLALDVLGRPEDAAAVAGAILDDELAAQPDRWRRIRREALSHGPPEAYAAALVEDGLVPDRARAAAAARDLARLREDGVDYEWAEGAWQLGADLFDPAERPARRPADARVPWDAALATVVATVRARATDTPPQVLFGVRARGATPAARAIGRSRPDLVVLSAPGGGSLLVGATSTSLIGLRRVSHALAQVIEAGDVELVVQLRDPAGEDRMTARLGGRVEDGTLRIRWSDAALDGAPWPAVRRYLAEPLSALPVALFPPPELVIRTESDEIAAELRREAEPMLLGRCQTAGPVLRCTMPGQPDQLGELLLRLARTRL